MFKWSLYLRHRSCGHIGTIRNINCWSLRGIPQCDTLTRPSGFSNPSPVQKQVLNRLTVSINHCDGIARHGRQINPLTARLTGNVVGLMKLFNRCGWQADSAQDTTLPHQFMLVACRDAG
ncbi:hypothetical protein DOJ06_24085 [Salmonella enterica subsp. enterica serovar Bareilly]|nr:hypothetical protein [Salmonella enterica subsp. enterica serovar Bareilly]